MSRTNHPLLSSRRHRVSDDPSGRSGQDRSRSVEGIHRSESSVGLLEGHLDALQVVDEAGRETVEVLLDARRQICINLKFDLNINLL